MFEIVKRALEALKLQRSALHDELSALAPAIEARGADSVATPDEEARAVALVSDINVADVKIGEHEARLAELGAINERTAALDAKAKASGITFIKSTKDEDLFAGDAQSLNNTDARAKALTAVERSRGFASDAHRSNLTALIESRKVGAVAARMALATGGETYGNAWAKAMSGQGILLSEQERVALARGFSPYVREEAEQRAGMTSGTGSTGGYLVPVYIDPTMIITGAGSTNPFRKIARIINIGPASGGWYGATGAQVTAAWTGETSAAPDNTPTLTQPNIPVYMGEAFVPVSFQAFEDIADLAGDVVALIQDAKDNLEAIAHSTADGSSKPKGVSYAVGAITASRVSPTTAGTYGLVDAFAVHSALPARFIESPSKAWVASMTIHDKSRQLAMAQNSANSVWTDIIGNVPAKFIGDRVYTSQSMSTSLTTGQDVLLFGDFSRYVIVDRLGLTTEFIPNLFDTSTGRPTASRGWLAHWRTGADVTDVNAFRQLRL